MTKSQDILNGMKAICQYMGRSEATVQKYHRELNLPIRKMNPSGKKGPWQGSKKAIDQWNHDLVSAG